MGSAAGLLLAGPSWAAHGQQGPLLLPPSPAAQDRPGQQPAPDPGKFDLPLASRAAPPHSWPAPATAAQALSRQPL